MAKAEEELQRVDFKVHVNCCDGCKRKVKKALDIKGVLKIEIHPSLPKLTIIGNFDVRILLKRLAKVGKTAEIIPTTEETKKPKKEETKKPNDSDEKGKPKEEKSKEEKALKDKSKTEDAEKQNETKNEGKDHKKPKNNEESKETMENKDEFSIEPMITTTIPNYMIHPNMVTSNPPPMYYQMMPMPCYSMNNPYQRPIPYGYGENGYYEAPLNRRIPPPPVHSQATVFTEYFNEDNTASCHVM